MDHNRVYFFILILLKTNLRHFDSLALDFLRQISTLFLFTEVNLWFHSGEEDDLTVYRAILDHLSPLLHGIDSMSFNQSAIPLVEQYFAQKLAQIKMLHLHFECFRSATIQTAITFALNWLTSGERNSAEPRLLQFWCTDTNNAQQFLTTIQEVTKY